jgi:spermidine/putrescine transport system substrate-binding protein
MKKLFTCFVLSVFTLILATSVFAEVEVADKSYYEKFKDQNITINVYNWGEYISDGSEDSMDVIKEFEEISGIDVNYTLFDTNEDMYAKLTNSTNVYDIIVPSDYMVARLIEEDRLEKINYDNIPNIKFVDDRYRFVDFDPSAEYSVPYTWNLVGLVYNTKYVTKEQASSWNVLWDESLKNKVLMFGNVRDAFGIALVKLGYSMNTENPDEIRAAAEELMKQKEVNQAYAMDQTFDKMANENAYAAPYYAGDCLTMMKRNDDLAFTYPKEGVNIFIDAFCIPKGTQNKEAAEAFINFMCETEVAAANCEFISYFTPQTEANKLIEVDERIVPSDEVIEKSETFVMLSDDANALMESLWISIRATSPFNNTIFPLAIILGLALVIFIILFIVRKRKKDKNYY